MRCDHTPPMRSTVDRARWYRRVRRWLECSSGERPCSRPASHPAVCSMHALGDDDGIGMRARTSHTHTHMTTRGVLHGRRMRTARQRERRMDGASERTRRLTRGVSSRRGEDSEEFRPGCCPLRASRPVVLVGIVRGPRAQPHATCETSAPSHAPTERHWTGNGRRDGGVNCWSASGALRTTKGTKKHRCDSNKPHTRMARRWIDGDSYILVLTTNSAIDRLCTSTGAPALSERRDQRKSFQVRVIEYV
jgi:hypothetical protein